ncbi:flagellar biosynthetic protein FliQ [Ectothiorhodospiraceae bacterium BW-2]|nr:flagellar biosynthetic protein FliQ [Ectothiorhodospiraceae bacterium BW-2]
MEPGDVLTVFNQTLEIILLLTMATLLPALAIGLIVAMFQAATQIQEMTLSFIPKLIITFMVLMYAGSWMLQLMMEFTTNLYERIPMLIG